MDTGLGGDCGAPEDLVVLEHEVRTVDVVVAVRCDPALGDLNDASVLEVVERVLPGVEVVLAGDHSTDFWSEGKDHSTGSPVHSGRDHLSAVHLDRHVRRIRRGDTAIGAVHDGALEGVEGLVPGGVGTEVQAEGGVRKSVAHNDVAVSGQGEHRLAEVEATRLVPEAAALMNEATCAADHPAGAEGVMVTSTTVALSTVKESVSLTPSTTT